jgi:hypothetical protein
MQRSIALVAALAALTAASAADAASVEVKDAVARVTVIPENRQDVKVEIVSSNPKLPIEVRQATGRTIIDGKLRRRIRECRGTGEGARVEVRQLGAVAFHDMPQIVIRTPRDVDIDAGGAIWGSVGRSANLDLGNAGCGDWVVGNVEGRMRVSQAGSGATRTGSAAEAKIRVAGSGDSLVGDVRGPLDVDIAGSGDVRVASVAGPLEINLAGSGDVRVAAGRASRMTVTIAGSGDVDFGGVADSLKARIMGSGSVHAHEVRGEVAKTIMGSGRVGVGH